MREIALPTIGTVKAWRKEARALAAEGIPAEEVLWRVGEGPRDLFALGGSTKGEATPLTLSKAAISEIECALSHSDPERFTRAYDLVLRLSRKQVRWGNRSDAGVRRVMEQAKAVRRDIHKMHAFVRFRELPSRGDRRAFAAWFEPTHPCVEAGTPFFAKRFGDMDWVIATPTLTARFEDGRLSFEETSDRRPPPEDATEGLWRTYFANIFNPARLMISAMQSEMPKKYWKNLPEADLIPELIRSAPARAEAMQAALPTLPPERRAAVARRMAVPERTAPLPGSLDALREEAERCTRCALCGPATQTVFGEGPPDASLMIVGEQPGDLEDLSGRPLVGPAGQLFDHVAAEAGLVRSEVYLTNAVKHFKFTPRGKRRIHQRPNAGEIDHCRWWLDLERRLVRPKLLVAMGATAALSLTGRGEGLLKRRGKVEETVDGEPVLITLHPSFILRTPDKGLADARLEMLKDDFKKALHLSKLSAP